MEDGESRQELLNEELVSTIEELRVSQEELLRRNEELFDASALVDEARRRYADLFEGAPVAYFVTDGNGTILEANRRLGDLLGIESRFLVHKPLAVFVPMGERRRLRAGMSRVLATGSVTGLEFAVVPRGSKPRSVDATLEAEASLDGESWWIRWALVDVTERKRDAQRVQAANVRLERRVRERTAEAELERTRLQAVVEQLPLAVALVDRRTGEVLLRNPEVDRILGDDLDLVRLRGRRADGAEYAPGGAPAARALARGDIVRGERVELQRNDGGWIVLDVTAGPVRDPAGDIVAVVLVFQDVTQRQRAEEREQLLAAVAALLVGSLETDALLAGLADVAARRYADLARVDVAAAGGSVAAVAVAGDPRYRSVLPSDLAAEVLESGRPFLCSSGLAAELKRRNVGVDSCVVVPLAVRGEVFAALTFARSRERPPFAEADLDLALDIALRVSLAVENSRLRGELERERDRLGQLLDRLEQAVVAVAGDGRVEWANAPARLLLGGDDRWRESLPDEWRAAAAALFERDEPLEHRETLADGRAYLVVGIPPRVSGTAILVLTDVSERERRERAEREFVANAAHELRTPVAAIASAVEVLQAGAKEKPAERDLFLAHIERESARLTRLARALLVLARAQSRQEQPPLAVVELRPLLEQVAAAIVPAEGVDVVVECPAGLAVVAEPHLTEQALVSLAANAARFTEAGTITLAAYRDGDSAVLEVRDTGSGIDDAERERIFDRFYRGSVRDADGFGLGLSIVRQAVDTLGGTLSVESGPGEGTTVRMQLRAAELTAA